MNNITSPDTPAFEAFSQALAERADALDLAGTWPSEQLALARQAGVFGWFVPPEWGGAGWSGRDSLSGALGVERRDKFCGNPGRVSRGAAEGWI